MEISGPALGFRSVDRRIRPYRAAIAVFVTSFVVLLGLVAALSAQSSTPSCVSSPYSYSYCTTTTATSISARVPEFGTSAILVAVLALLAVALLSRKMRPEDTKP